MLTNVPSSRGILRRSAVVVINMDRPPEFAEARRVSAGTRLISSRSTSSRSLLTSGVWARHDDTSHDAPATAPPTVEDSGQSAFVQSSFLLSSSNNGRKWEPIQSGDSMAPEEKRSGFMVSLKMS